MSAPHFNYPGYASELPEAQRFCTHCSKPLTGRIVWLEADTRDFLGMLRQDGKVPPEFSQGWWPFGRKCAARLLEQAHALETEK